MLPARDGKAANAAKRTKELGAGAQHTLLTGSHETAGNEEAG